MFKPLLIEIGVEELPAIPFLKELPNIEKKWEKILEDFSLVSEFDFFYTPRRLVLYHSEFLEKQPDFEEEIFGPPVDIAFKDNSPTKAAMGFAKKCGVDIEKIETIKKGDREVLYFKKVIEGKKSEEILEEMINRWLKSLNFGRSMRWDESGYEFIRPIRWGIVNFGNKFLNYEIFGVKSLNFTYINRSISLEKVEIKNIKEYFEKLENGGVILYQDKREEKILSDFKKIEEEQKVKIEKDRELLEEIVAITEYPTAHLGKFDERFLDLPPEVIITSMKEHQRYFPLFKDGFLYNGFIVVSNSYTDDYSLIVNGNEKVLKARLSDAYFFWEQDLKNGLDIEGLKEIMFMDELGTIFDKEIREAKITEYLFEKYKDRILLETGLGEGEVKALFERAIMLSKADLLTQMVYEFTELQGVMGYYYALEQGEDELVALAIKEQYLPSGEESDLPSTLFSSVVSIAVKLDTIMALFSIGKIPSGSKDPFGLRRAANGVIKIVLNENLPFDISKIFYNIKDEYRDFDKSLIEEFFLERIYQYFDVNPSIIKAVIESGERDLVELSKKIVAVNSIVESSEFKDIFTTFKRVANIIKDIDLQQETEVDETLFESKYEKELYDKFKTVLSKEYEDYESKLDALFGLKSDIDRFFDHVLVNIDDEKLKTNRKNLIASIYKAFKEIADIKEITV